MDLTHTDKEGRAKIVDITAKNETIRTASAQGFIIVSPEIVKKIKENEISKGDVLTVSKIAGIMAAKKVPELLPLCHNIKITSIEIFFKILEQECKIIGTSTVSGFDKTGVEMEALVSVSLSLLNIYDMCKALSKEMVIGGIELVAKSGGRSNYNKF